MLKTISRISFVLLLSLASFSLVAQQTSGKKSANSKIDQQVNMLDQQLDLSDDQEAELTDVLVSAQEEYKDLSGKEKMNARKELDNDIKEVLNEGQVKEYEMMQKKMQKRRMQKMKQQQQKQEMRKSPNQ